MALNDSQYPMLGNPEYELQNEGNPYEANQKHSQQGQPYTSNLAGKSTLVSDNMEMAKRLKAFVPRSSVKQGDTPARFGEGASSQENDQASNYKSKYQ